MSDAPTEIRDNYEEIIPGVYAGVPNEVYHASEGISCSGIKELGKSVEHYEWMKRFPLKQTDPMLVGSALHDLCLLPDTYDSTYIVSPTKGKTTEGYKKTKKDNPDKDILTATMGENVVSMRDALYRNPTVRNILQGDTTLREVSIWVKDPITNLLLKVRPDIIHKGIIYDIKTTSGGVEPRGFLMNVYKYKYHVQDPFYGDCCSLNGMSIKGFKFLVVGSKPPYSTAIYDLNDELREKGRNYYEEALMRYKRCLTGEETWKGLPSGRETVTL